jgi:dynein heavy chain
VEKQSHSGDDDEKISRVETPVDGQNDKPESEGFQSPVVEEQGSDQDNVTSTKSSGLLSSNSPKYDAYLLSLIKSLVGGHQVRQWLNSGMGMRQMENASISMASWQRPPFLIDPHGRGLELVRRMEKNEKVVEIDVADG